jgi:hypothetical protein
VGEAERRPEVGGRRGESEIEAATSLGGEGGGGAGGSGVSNRTVRVRGRWLGRFNRP